LLSCTRPDAGFCYNFCHAADAVVVTLTDCAAGSFDRGQKNEKRLFMPRYWLMKSEPTCFSLDDLERSPEGTAPWDGVRNFQARNLLRDEIQAGDGVLFYHSSCSEPAIVGLAEVVRSGYPDHTAQDPRSEHYDPKAKPTNPIWYMVDVRFRARLPRPLTRTDLANHPVLAGMMVMQRGNRLSVQPVAADEWRAVLALAGVVDPL
jgi:predicted RNA-binding protein with PUA-like domain